MNKLKELYVKITDKKKWMQFKFEKSLYTIKKNEIILEIENATKVNNWQKMQELHYELIWLVIILEYDFKKEVIEIRKKEDFLKWAGKMQIELEIGLDKKAITNDLCLRYLQNDLIAPKNFESNNQKHVYFSEEITSIFEGISREIRFGNKVIKMNDIFLNKNTFYVALTFYSNFAQETIGSKYVFELRDLLKEIN